MTLQTADKLVQLYQADLYSFASGRFLVLFPGNEFFPNWHIELLAAKLEDARRGKTTRLSIHMPPRHSKSFMMAVVYPVWLLGHNPSPHVFLLSYGQKLSEEHVKCRLVKDNAHPRNDFSRGSGGHRRLPRSLDRAEILSGSKFDFKIAFAR